MYIRSTPHSLTDTRGSYPDVTQTHNFQPDGTPLYHAFFFHEGAGL